MLRLASDTVRRARCLIFLAERRSEVHDASAVARTDPLCREHRCRLREVIKRRLALPSCKFAAEATLALDEPGELRSVAFARSIGEPYRLAARIFEPHVDE